MDIIVTGRKTTVTDALRDYVIEKIGNATKVFDIEPMNADVVLRVEKNPSNPTPSTCEVTVRAKGAVIRVSESDADMYAAIDLAASRVERQLRKFKTKVIDRRHRAEPAPVNEAQPFTKEQMDELISDHSEEDVQLVREKVIDFTLLTEEQALVQTDLLGHDFFVFTNAATGMTNVIYHRKNGGYGILKPVLEEEE